MSNWSHATSSKVLLAAVARLLPHTGQEYIVCDDIKRLSTIRSIMEKRSTTEPAGMSSKVSNTALSCTRGTPLKDFFQPGLGFEFPAAVC